ncbi:class I SAM-dependent methyltransferase, partial [Campylobacter jejuni]|nr:class I SAM-dependent methyltransferase [Campylobacter jejuni]
MLECKIRNCCAVSGDAKLEKLSEISYPIFCSCTLDDISNDLIAKEEIVISKEGIIQLRQLIPLEILYKEEHGSGAVGQIWQNHHKEFAKFVLTFDPENVLEIGGAHGKLAKHCFDKKQLSWTIVEPNPSEKISNINYIESFFKKEHLMSHNYDTVIHSHTLEHIYEPNDFLESISSSMQGGGRMIFSIPNLKRYLENKWVNYLGFEHTILLTESAIDFLLSRHRFKIKAKQYFYDHSIFYCVEKDDNISLSKVVLKNEYEENKKLFFQMQEYYNCKIQELNLILKNDKTKNIYLFGAHIF